MRRPWVSRGCVIHTNVSLACLPPFVHFVYDSRMQFKALQWNIGGALIRTPEADPTRMESYCNESLEYIVNTIQDLDPDIITVQEAHTNSQCIQAKDVAAALGFAYMVNDTYDVSHLKDGERLSQAIISRFPLANHTFQLFINPLFKTLGEDGKPWTCHDKGISGCTIALSSTKELKLQTLHSIPFRKFGVDISDGAVQEVLTDMVSKINVKAPLLLLQGDFNLDGATISHVLPGLEHANMEEIAIAHPTTPKGRRYDHVVYRGIQVVAHDIFEHVLTDHFPLITTFEV